MASIELYEQLDGAVSALVASGHLSASGADPEIGELLAVADELRHLPRPAFKSALRSHLIATATTADFAVRAFPVIQGGGRSAESAKLERELKEMPTLFATSGATSPVQGRSLLTSCALHTVALGLVVWSGTWMMKTQPAQHATELIAEIIAPSDYVAQPSPKTLSGGGGGGERDKVAAPKGKVPKSAMEQITPPTMVIRNEHPLLPSTPTVILPPNVKLPDLAQLGDPLSHIVGPASNGAGAGGSIGRGMGGGIGAGMGPGVGVGQGGGIGGGVFTVGGGVSAPRVLYSPDPEYSPEARQAKYQGTVLLWAIIGPDGRPRALKVSRPLGMGLDEKAIEAVRKWRFEPALKDGVPVAVQVNIEVNFHLY
jgi:TonB family protein